MDRGKHTVDSDLEMSQMNDRSIQQNENRKKLIKRAIFIHTASSIYRVYSLMSFTGSPI